MGTSGQSTAPHVHTDCVKGRQTGIYSLADIEAGNPAPAPRQMNWFIDEELFRTDIYVTTYYADVEYQRKLKKVHLGYDVVPMNRHKTTANYGVYWPRSMDGIVTRVTFDPKGYGHYVMIAFEVEEDPQNG